jgi:hypothetical protein
LATALSNNDPSPRCGSLHNTGISLSEHYRSAPQISGFDAIFVDPARGGMETTAMGFKIEKC